MADINVLDLVAFECQKWCRNGPHEIEEEAKSTTISTQNVFTFSGFLQISTHNFFSDDIPLGTIKCCCVYCQLVS